MLCCLLRGYALSWTGGHWVQLCYLDWKIEANEGLRTNDRQTKYVASDVTVNSGQTVVKQSTRNRTWILCRRWRATTLTDQPAHTQHERERCEIVDLRWAKDTSEIISRILMIIDNVLLYPFHRLPLDRHSEEEPDPVQAHSLIIHSVL